MENKIKIENLIKNEVINYNILRLPEIIDPVKIQILLLIFFITVLKIILLLICTKIPREILDVEDAISVWK